MSNAWQFLRKNGSPVWRRAIVFFAGSVILIIGVVMLVLPGPALVFIPLGLAILASGISMGGKVALNSSSMAAPLFSEDRI